MRLRKFLIGLASLLLVVNAAVAIYLYRSANADFIPERPDTSVGQPKNFRVYDQDDRAAVLTWNPPAKIAALKKDQDVTGYQVSWGKEGEALDHVQLTAYTVYQPQPLENGVRYQAQVQSIDKNGKLSAPAPLLTFTGDDTRVKKMEKDFAFFDDFNLPAGQYDSKKWSYSCNVNVAANECGVFINNQFHAHTQVTSRGGFWDRSQVAAIARPVFDISNDRTGTIVWDEDSPGGRGRGVTYITLHAANNYENSDTLANASLYRTDQWVHVVAPYSADRNAKENGAAFNITMSGAGISMTAFNKEGIERKIASLQDYANPMAPYVAINVRLHYKLLISQKHVVLEVNDKKLLDADLTDAANPKGLEADRFFFGWMDSEYNTSKSNNHERAGITHYDNIGFDGPANDVVTHAYGNGVMGNPSQPAQDSAKKRTTSVIIPDSIVGKDGKPAAVARIAMVPFGTSRAVNAYYNWKASDRLKINGTLVEVPNPIHLFSIIPGGALVTPQIVVPIDPNLVKQGTNEIETLFLAATQTPGKPPVYINAEPFRTTIELDYSKANEPAAFTQESAIYPSTVFKPAATSSGLNIDVRIPGTGYIAGLCSQGIVETTKAVIAEDPVTGVLTTADGKTNSTPASKNACNSGKPFAWKELSGIQTFTAVYSPSKMLIETGANQGMARMDMYLDGRLNLALYTNKDVPIPSLPDPGYPVRLDTTNLCNGIHSVFVGGYTGAGVFSHNLWYGDYTYLNFKVNNPGQADCSKDLNHISHDTPNFYAAGLVPPAECLTATGQKADCHDHPDIISKKISIQLTAKSGVVSNIAKAKMDVYEGDKLVKAYTDLIVDNNGILEVFTPAQLMDLSDDLTYKVVLNVPGYLERTLSAVPHILTQKYVLSSDERLDPIPETRKAAISAITEIASSGSYKVEFGTTNFTPVSGGAHVHFYFDTEAPDVRNKMFSGASPYTLAKSLVLAGAKKLCIIVANADHSVASNTGNCIDMPVPSNAGGGNVQKSAAISKVTAIGTPVATGYTVDFTTTGFTPAANATHVNFYFDNQAQTVTDKVVTKVSPYVLSRESVITGATKICIIAAESDNTVIAGSGNCTDIPQDVAAGGGGAVSQKIEATLAGRFNTTAEGITGASLIIYNPSTKAEVKRFSGLTIGTGGKLEITDKTSLEGIDDATTYDLEFQVPMFLHRVVKGVSKILSTPFSLGGDTLLVPGDGNGNNQIDLSDIGILIAAYNEQLPKTHQLYKIYHGKVGLENIAQIAQLYNGSTVGDTYK